MSQSVPPEFQSLLAEVRRCKSCLGNIPEPRPVLQAHPDAKILIVGQAPGSRVHASGIPWDDASGKRLRHWMGICERIFYDPCKIAIMPMGFCYPGRGKSGDLPPQPECAPLWHGRILQQLPEIRFTLLIGLYAQQYYLPKQSKNRTLTENIRNWQSFLPETFVLPHPSPRNTLWLKKNPWFEEELVPELRGKISALLQ